MGFKEDSEWGGGTVLEEDIFSVQSFYLSLLMLFYPHVMSEREIWTEVPELPDSEFCFS